MLRDVAFITEVVALVLDSGMRVLPPIAFVGLICLCIATVAAEDAHSTPPRSLVEVHRFELTSTSDRYVLDEQVEYTYTLLNESATRQTSYFIYEPFYAPVRRIRGEMGGHRLRGDDIRAQQAESRDVFLTGGR